MSTLDTALDQYLSHLLVEKGLSDNTLSSYGRDLRDFSAFLAGEGVEDPAIVDTAHILKHLIGLRNKGLSARSRARHLVAVRGFFRFLAAEKLIEKDPARLVDLPKSGLALPDGRQALIESSAAVRVLRPTEAAASSGPDPRPGFFSSACDDPATP